VDNPYLTEKRLPFNVLFKNTFDPTVDNPDLTVSRSGNPYSSKSLNTIASVLVNDFVRGAPDLYELRGLIQKQLEDDTLKTKDKLPRNVRSANIALGDLFFEKEDKEKAEILQHEIEHVRGQKAKKYYTQITEQDKKLPTEEFKQLIKAKRRQANSPRFHKAVENFQNVFGHNRETAALKTNLLTINAVSDEAGSINNTSLLKKALKELGVDTDTLRGKEESRYSSKGFLRKYIEEKYNITPTYVANVDLGDRDDVYVMPYSFEEAVADLSMIEVMNNVDITQDPVIKNVIFNNDPETIQVYKAVSGLRTDRLDAKDLPPFTAQKIKEPTPPLLPYPDSSKSLLEELKSFFAKEKPKKSAALSDKDQVNENKAFLKNITEIKKKNGGEVKKTSLVDSIPVEGYPEGYQNVLNAPQQSEDLPTQDYALGALEAVPLAATSLASAVAGPIYGIFKNIASGKFGTQEGIRIADQAASEMMQKLTYEPESKSLTNFMSAVGDIATKYKLDAAIPQLLTVPIPGPASGRYAGVKTGEEIVDFMERQYAKQRDAGEFGDKNPLRDILLPTRLDIFQGAKSKNFDLTSAYLFDKAEKETLTENPDISRYDLNIKSWQKTVDAVKRGEAQFPTFRGMDNELRQEVPDTGFNFKLPMAMVGTTGSLIYPKNFESIKKGEKERGDGNVQMGFAPQKMILKEVDKGRNFFVVDAKNFSNYKDIDFDAEELETKDLLTIEAQEANPFKKVKLEEVIDFPDLFKAYENLKKNTFQIVKDRRSDVKGSFDASTGEIKATPKKISLGEVGSEKGYNTKAIENITRSFRIKASRTEEEKKSFEETIKRLEDQGKRQQKENFALQEEEKEKASKEYRNTVLHEVQHAIQEMEGFAKGTNTDASRYNVSSLVESLGQKRRKLLEEENKIVDELNILKFEQPVSIPLNLELYKKQKQKKINNLLEKKRKLSEQEQVLEDLSQKFTRYARATDYYTYERSTGEAEARLVEKRKDLSMEERLKTFPLSDLDVQEGSTFPSKNFGSKADDDYQKQVNNFIIQQLGPKQAKDLGFDKE